MDKLIKAEDIFIAIRDDVEISGTNFARVVDHLKNMKPVDAVEVVHGRWIKRPDERICPFCNDRHSYFGGEDWNYCPNCGALMDGDKHE